MSCREIAGNITVRTIRVRFIAIEATICVSRTITTHPCSLLEIADPYHRRGSIERSRIAHTAFLWHRIHTSLFCPAVINSFVSSTGWKGELWWRGLGDSDKSQNKNMRTQCQSPYRCFRHAMPGRPEPALQEFWMKGFYSPVFFSLKENTIRNSLWDCVPGRRSDRKKQTMLKKINYWGMSPLPVEQIVPGLLPLQHSAASPEPDWQVPAPCLRSLIFTTHGGV